MLINNKKVFPTLYKLDNKGKIREWIIYADNECGYPVYTMRHGIRGGKIQSTCTSVKQGKNIGRANETTAWEQCVSEAESLWTKQRDRKGYTETVPSEKPFRPMLAKSYDKDGKKIKFPCYAQPKLDGIRCLAFYKDGKIHLMSRQGKFFTALPHLEKQLGNLLFDENEIWDGELYIHGENFQSLTSAIKRDEASDESANIEYHVYDCFDKRHPNDTFKERHEWLTSQKMEKYDHLKFVETKIINTTDEVEVWHKYYTSKGYEGIMLRNTNGEYKINGRSSDLQKVKKFMDHEFEIVDAEECKGKMEGMCAFYCKTDDGTLFKCMPEGTEAQRKQYWTDYQAGEIKGKKLTVRFFAWTDSEKSVPRFPIGISIRDYE